MVISGGIFQVTLMGFTGLCLFFPAPDFKISPVDNISQYKALKNDMRVRRITQQLSPQAGYHLSWKSFLPSIRFYLLFFIIHKC
jgi:hypothetical protein